MGERDRTLHGDEQSRSKAQRHSDCAHQVGCDRQGRPKQAKGEMQTCLKRAASEDERNLARARTLQCDASVGEMLLGLLVSDDVPGAEVEELEMAIFDISSPLHGANGS